jgi:hypothetical protein
VPGLSNSLYAYNGENSAWEQTRITITYFENLFIPYVKAHFSESVTFKFGAGLVIPINQEQKIRNFYPVIQSRIQFAHSKLDLGSLDNDHDFVAPILDPLTTVVPQIRLGDSSQIPITYENFPVGKFTHGIFEYGLSYKWFNLGHRGEIYINWQLPDTVDHRERFDIGFTDRLESFPLYIGLHYWHNGGHENPHTVSMTENYTASLGFRTDSYNALVLGSLFFADRDSGSAVNGGALYFDYTFRIGNWKLQPLVFASHELVNANSRFISIEGDPFFRAPFYMGVNVGANWEILKDCNLEFGLVNGIFQRSAGTAFSPTQLRYDQLLRFTVKYEFDKT